MCGIYCSFDRKIFETLKTLNSYRGSVNESLTEFNGYLIGHSQAPTSKTSHIHPAAYKNAKLWHNGLILGMNDKWDTEYILTSIHDNGFKSLSDLEGSFACVYQIDNELFVFRNELSPLFIDDDLNISSTKFIYCHDVEPNVIFKVDLFNKRLIKISEFKTKNNPYYFND